MRILSRILALALGLSVSGALAEEIPGSTFFSGNWLGAAYTYNDTGEFSHCVVSAEYRSGDTLLLSVTRQATVNVGVVSTALRHIPEGQTFPVRLTVDGRNQFFGSATSGGQGVAYLTLREFDRAMEAMKRGFTLVVEGAGLRGVYSLEGTFRALEETRACALKYYTYAAAPANPPTPQPTPVDKTQMFQVASVVIAELGIKDFRYLGEAELVELGWEGAVAWESESAGMFGFTTMNAWDGVSDLKESDPTDTQFMAQACGGDYITSVRSINFDDGNSAARELRLLCQEEGDEIEIFVSKFLASDAIVYNGLIFDGKRPATNTQPRADQSRAATLRAASYFVE